MTLTAGALSEAVDDSGARVRDALAEFVTRLFAARALLAVITNPGTLAIAPHPKRIIP